MLRRIRRRYEAALNVLPITRLHAASGLREAFRAGYTGKNLRADVLAGIVVGIVALPLSMALAIASGVPPQHGLYTAIIVGGVIALLGGSRVQVSGPTAAFVVILAPIAHLHGLGGLLVSTMFAGVILLILGVARLGRLIEFIPYPVTTGFTAGIGVVIGTLQVKDLLGLSVEKMPEAYLERLYALALALPTARWQELVVGVFCFATLILWPRVTKKLPAPLVALAASALFAYALTVLVPGFSVATIHSRFSYVADGQTHPGIPQLPPLPVLPWTLPGADGRPLELSLALLRELAGPAFAIAMLGAIESLLSAVVADGMIGGKHNPDSELMAQGLGNIVAPFFGGIAATGAIARTATNVRAGGRSPVASIVHALFVLLAVLTLAPLLGHLPMAALAALLLLVAWNMSEARHVVHVLKVAPKSDKIVLLACLLLTVVFDMVVSVTAGVMLAALLFMRRMAEVSDVRLVEEHEAHAGPLPPSLLIYEIAGPLFFGAAQKAMSELQVIHSQVRAVVLDLRGVPAMDATGLVNLESAMAKLAGQSVKVYLGGVRPQPRRVLEGAGVAGRVFVASTVEEALEQAKTELSPASGAGSRPAALP